MQMSHKISGVTGPKFTKFVAVVTFFVGGVNATVRVAVRPPVVDYEGRHLKKKVTSVRHNPAGGIALLGRLTNKQKIYAFVYRSKIFRGHRL